MMRTDPHNRPIALPVWPQSLLVAGLALAGVLHLVLTADHFEESTLMGVGFLGSALAEFALAGAVLVRPQRLVYGAVIGVATVLIGLYAYNVMVGLPYSASAEHSSAVEGSHAGDASHSTDGHHDSGTSEAGRVEGEHHSDGLVLGQGEPVDALGAATKLSELAAITIAVGLLTRGRFQRRRQSFATHLSGGRADGRS